MHSLLQRWKEPAATVQSITTVIAIIIGGWWTYSSFIRTRQDRPKLAITHTVQHFQVSKHRFLLCVRETLSNTSPVAIELTKGEIRVNSTLPLSKNAEDTAARTNGALGDNAEDPEIWPLLGRNVHDWDKHRELIEPGEVDMIQNYFLIPDSAEVINIESFAANPAEGNQMAWRAMTMYKLRLESGPPGN